MAGVAKVRLEPADVRGTTRTVDAFERQQDARLVVTGARHRLWGPSWARVDRRRRGIVEMRLERRPDHPVARAGALPGVEDERVDRPRPARRRGIVEMRLERRPDHPVARAGA